MGDFELSLDKIQHKLRTGEISTVQVVQSCLANAEQHKNLNAYIELWAEEAITKAQEIDNKLNSNTGILGPLFGLVVSIKDVVAYQDHRLSAASRILQDYVSPFSATVVERLLDADAIIIGRTNCDEFAMGSDNSNSYYGPSSNALDDETVPGGSSGGAAISASINSCHIAIGSDTGGSVRQPAAFHNLYGFKPSYGRLSRHGLIAYASSFDQIGLIGKDWRTIWRVYECIQGPDQYDSTLVHDHDIEDQKQQLERPIKIGCIQGAFEHKSMDENIKKQGQQAIAHLKENPELDVSYCDCELIDYLVPIYYVLTAAEASSNLSRFDGVRYGYRNMDSSGLLDTYINSRSEGFSEEVKRRIMLGTFVLSSGYYDAYYGKAQKMRQLVKARFDELFATYDLIALPTTPVKAWLKSSSLSPVEIYLSDIFSVLANILGAAAVSIPLNLDKEGSACNIQLLSKSFFEHTMDQGIRAIEKDQLEK